MSSQNRVIVSLDFPDGKQALDLCQKLDPNSCKLKIGKELFTREGPVLVEKLIASDFDIFLDLKYHDIPNTVASACRAAADLGGLVQRAGVLFLACWVGVCQHAGHVVVACRHPVAVPVCAHRRGPVDVHHRHCRQNCQAAPAPGRGHPNGAEVR